MRFLNEVTQIRFVIIILNFFLLVGERSIKLSIQCIFLINDIIHNIMLFVLTWVARPLIILNFANFLFIYIYLWFQYSAAILVITQVLTRVPHNTFFILFERTLNHSSKCITSETILELQTAVLNIINLWKWRLTATLLRLGSQTECIMVRQRTLMTVRQNQRRILVLNYFIFD